MKNHPLYRLFEQKITEQGLSIEGIKLLDFNTAAKMLGTRKFPLALLDGMKLVLIDEKRQRQDESDKQLFAARIEKLREHFPDIEVERGREDNKPFVKIWLQGKPEGPDVNGLE